MRAIDHQAIRRSVFGDQVCKDAVEDAHAGPANEPVIQRLVRTVDFRSIPPSQAVSDRMDYTADHAPIIYARHAMRPWEIGFDAFELGLAEPVMIRHGQVLVPCLNHNFNKDGIPWQGMTELRTKLPFAAVAPRFAIGGSRLVAPEMRAERMLSALISDLQQSGGR